MAQQNKVFISTTMTDRILMLLYKTTILDISYHLKIQQVNKVFMTPILITGTSVQMVQRQILYLLTYQMTINHTLRLYQSFETMRIQSLMVHTFPQIQIIRKILQVLPHLHIIQMMKFPVSQIIQVTKLAVFSCGYESILA